MKHCYMAQIVSENNTSLGYQKSFAQRKIVFIDLDHHLPKGIQDNSGSSEICHSKRRRYVRIQVKSNIIFRLEHYYNSVGNK